MEELEGDAKQEGDVGREVRAEDEGEAMDIDESDNEDTGADAEDEEVASQKEGLENVSRRHPLQLI